MVFFFTINTNTFLITGMLIVGCLLRNIPVVNIAKDINPVWSSALRYSLLLHFLQSGHFGIYFKQIIQMVLLPI